MQSLLSPAADSRPRLLVVELWGIGDVALAIPFLRMAAQHARVSLLAKPHAQVLIQHFCPEVELIPFTAPWTAFNGKYQLQRWPWRDLFTLIKNLRKQRWTAAVSARPDPRDHALMTAAGVKLSLGFPCFGSRLLLNAALERPTSPHRFAHWQTVAMALGENLPTPITIQRTGRHIVIHTGAAQPTRQWGDNNFQEIATRLRKADYAVTLLDEQSGDLTQLLATLATADRFIGNDSGPGHLAALLGVPTFTIFGAQLAERFHPIHPEAAWMDGAPCLHKPCNDYCRYVEPHCIRDITIETTWSRLATWLAHSPAAAR